MILTIRNILQIHSSSNSSWSAFRYKNECSYVSVWYAPTCRTENTMLYSKNNIRITRNTQNRLWLLTPTQLLIQGQWWSQFSTHLLQNLQCRMRLVRAISQIGHTLSSWLVSISCWNFSRLFLFTQPGFDMDSSTIIITRNHDRIEWMIKNVESTYWNTNMNMPR